MITYGKPYKPASPDSIRRWAKQLFTDAKIRGFTPHSCRAASTNKAMAIMNINIEDILRKGCWKNANNFYKVFYRDILFLEDEAHFTKNFKKCKFLVFKY